MPRLIRLITHLVPARYFLTTLRGIFLKGYGFGMIWPELAALAGFAVLVFVVCLKRLKLRLDKA
jgi:ABC-2 type transport system permease protein